MAPSILLVIVAVISTVVISYYIGLVGSLKTANNDLAQDLKFAIERKSHAEKLNEELQKGMEMLQQNVREFMQKDVKALITDSQVNLIVNQLIESLVHMQTNNTIKGKIQ